MQPDKIALLAVSPRCLAAASVAPNDQGVGLGI
jgi:hypothetical protein